MILALSRWLPILRNPFFYVGVVLVWPFANRRPVRRSLGGGRWRDAFIFVVLATLIALGWLLSVLLALSVSFR